jgi:hypothetical protein
MASSLAAVELAVTSLSEWDASIVTSQPATMLMIPSGDGILWVQDETASMLANIRFMQLPEIQIIRMCASLPLSLRKPCGWPAWDTEEGTGKKRSRVTFPGIFQQNFMEQYKPDFILMAVRMRTQRP